MLDYCSPGKALEGICIDAQHAFMNLKIKRGGKGRGIFIAFKKIKFKKIKSFGLKCIWHTSKKQL